ncbi:MAG TPA: hypothetical protein VHH36_07785, partial [Candidatus Thermoplasmatota archaeon]|nr:hypothetical protein [Candidatus Thermoplasmatota archaeon]
MRPHPILLTLLLLSTSLPLAAAQAPSAVSAWGPDAEGAWWLAYDVVRDAPGRVSLRLDVAHADGGPAA